MKNKISSSGTGINIRKVTADFNNYFIESKQGKEKTPKEEMKESTFSNVLEESVLQGQERRESYAAECENELRDIIINDI